MPSSSGSAGEPTVSDGEGYNGPGTSGELLVPQGRTVNLLSGGVDSSYIQAVLGRVAPSPDRPASYSISVDHHTTRLDDEYALTASEALRAIRRRELSASALLESLLDRIAEVEPAVRAWEVVDAAGARRQAADAERAVGRGASLPFFGIPIGLKDIYETRDLPTSAGFPPWSGRVTDHDAATTGLFESVVAPELVEQRKELLDRDEGSESIAHHFGRRWQAKRCTQD